MFVLRNIPWLLFVAAGMWAILSLVREASRLSALMSSVLQAAAK